MYLRPVFTVTDQARIVGLIEANSFGQLITVGAGGMEASHVPFIVSVEDGQIVLEGHLGAANGQCAARSGGQGLATFCGPHAYIAPGWYKTQPAVPTWDYAAVHIHGTLELVEDEASISAMLRTLAKDDPKKFDLDGIGPVSPVAH